MAANRVSPSVMKPNGLIEFTAPAPMRPEVYERDNYTCRDCGIIGQPGMSPGCIQAWHLISLREGGENTIDNLITVCVECRSQRERRRERPSRLSVKNASRHKPATNVESAADRRENQLTSVAV